MVPDVVLVLAAVALVAAVLGVASGRLPADPLVEPVRSTPDTGLPEVPAAADVDAVRFDTALRGYRMADVDARLEELREELAERERALATLCGDAGGRHPVGVADDPGHPPAGDGRRPADPADPYDPRGG
ncbi:hypothetical protein GCM10023168_33440 [Fodinibacter luteus]|uniref:DivIVA domain-containing protein n=1 Tax=Fodinibacter luteus TaxID=552064 RepID=A0ABP8KQQ0_9MICO